MTEMRINANETAVLVVDYQEKLLPAMSGLRNLWTIPKSCLRVLRSLECP